MHESKVSINVKLNSTLNAEFMDTILNNLRGVKSTSEVSGALGGKRTSSISRDISKALSSALIMGAVVGCSSDKSQTYNQQESVGSNTETKELQNTPANKPGSLALGADNGKKEGYAGAFLPFGGGIRVSIHDINNPDNRLFIDLRNKDVATFTLPYELSEGDYTAQATIYDLDSCSGDTVESCSIIIPFEVNPENCTDYDGKCMTGTDAVPSPAIDEEFIEEGKTQLEG